MGQQNNYLTVISVHLTMHFIDNNHCQIIILNYNNIQVDRFHNNAYVHIEQGTNIMKFTYNKCHELPRMMPTGGGHTPPVQFNEKWVMTRERRGTAVTAISLKYSTDSDESHKGSSICPALTLKLS